MQTITPEQLQTLLSQTPVEQHPLLLDVREPFEHEICHINNSTLIPMGEIQQRLQELDEEQAIVVICHHGMRSMQVALFLENNGFSDITNLTGGIDAWATQVEPAMPRY